MSLEILEMIFVVTGIFAEEIFVDGNSAEGISAERNFRRTGFSLNGIFAVGNVAERNFRRTQRYDFKS